MKTDIKIAGDYLDLIVMHPASPEDVPCGEYFYEWDGTEEYSSRKFACSVEKQPDRDFVILNFADIQCHDGEAFCHVGEFSEETMDKLIRRTKPDLITLTGDNAFELFGKSAALRTVYSEGIHCRAGHFRNILPIKFIRCSVALCDAVTEKTDDVIFCYHKTTSPKQCFAVYKNGNIICFVCQ